MGDADAELVVLYSAALRRHVDHADGTTLAAARELGEQALAAGLTLLDLVTVHHSQRAAVLEQGADAVVRADEFLREALSSHEIAEVNYRAARRDVATERERVELLGQLYDAHIAVLATVGLEARLGVVCDRAIALVGGARAAIELPGIDGGRPRSVRRGEGPTGTPPARLPIPARPGQGVLEVWPAAGRYLSRADRAVLGQLALLASGAIDDSRRLERERAASLRLQRSLLPAALPRGERFRAVARYLASGRTQQVGGDWYDLIPLDDNRVAAVIGDVMGHGLGEAALMAAMRVAFHAYALEGVTAAATVERVDRLLARLAPDHLATAVLVVVELDQHRLHVVNAGHPLPLLIDPSGRPTTIGGGRSLPLGVRPDDERPEVAAEGYEPGTTLLLYTDGLTETLERAGVDASARIVEVVDGFRGSVDELCDRVLDAMLPGGASADDVCVLALRIT